MQERSGTSLRGRLAVAVRSIKWSYAIFWSSSATQSGVLEWADGYYNGGFKTRLTVQVMDLHADKMGLQRSEQLRNLYLSLLEGEFDQVTKNPSSALSPEDLSDAEWYYLVCMSFVFNPGQGLPGRALTNDQSIWLCNASYADGRVFSRSLLAKSASIQTVVCFPYLGGVFELGVTELVSEDPSLIQHIKTSFLELSKPFCSEKFLSNPCDMDDDQDPVCLHVEENLCSSPQVKISFDQDSISDISGIVCENLNNDCSNGCEHSQLMEDSFHESGNFMNIFNFWSKELQDCRHTQVCTPHLRTDGDLHYSKTLFTILRRSDEFIEQLCFKNSDRKSSFGRWKRRKTIIGHKSQEQQATSKKVLCLVPLGTLHAHRGVGGNGFICNDNKSFMQHKMSDKRTESGKFFVLLGSMVPTVSKIDKASILHDMIKYLKEARAEELESRVGSADYGATGRRTYLDMVEKMSDYYDDGKTEIGQKPWLAKRKASEVDETEVRFNKTFDMKVTVKEGGVLIEIRYPF